MVYASVMFKTGKLVGVALVVLVMSGCASAGASEDVAKSDAPEVEVSAPVLTAEPAPANAVEVEFLTAVQRIPGLEDVTMDAALVVGHAVCDQLASGADPLTMAPVENGDEQANMEAVMVSALTLCVEQSEAAQAKFTERSTNAAEAAMNG